MRSLFVAAALMLVAVPAIAKKKDDAPPPVDRPAALARAQQFVPLVEPALTAPMTDLYLKAATGDGRDKWAYALSLVAGRDNLDSAPPAQKQIYLDYTGRVAAARQAYQKKHPRADLSKKYMNDWVKPTPEEVAAVKLVNLIHDTDYWFGALDGLDAAAVAQSRQCLTGIKDALDAEDMMRQILAGFGDVATDSESGESVDLAALINGTGDEEAGEPEPKDDATLDEEAICGGAEAYAHVRVLFQAVYKPTLQITITTDRK